jgi:SAM-dependent methyltransferase
MKRRGRPWPVNAEQPALRGLSRQFVKLCELSDFEDPQLRAMLRDIEPGAAPAEEVQRKFWEYALLGLYLQEVGALRDDAEALAVAAGHEAPLYWMANRVARMVATDIYGQGAFATNEADSTMLTDPASFAPYAYREDHLEVRSMNALQLDFPDASFDIVFSLSSIEHFGGPRATEGAAQEMSRVLRPGGHLVITTECLVRNHPVNWPLLQPAVRIANGLARRCPIPSLRRRMAFVFFTDMFTPREIERYIVRPTGLELVQPLDTRVSAETYENVLHWTVAGDLQSATGEPWPHILLQAQGAPWTSAFLALRKPT